MRHYSYEEVLEELRAVVPATADYLGMQLRRVQDDSRLKIEEAVHELALRYRAALLINAHACREVVDVGPVDTSLGRDDERPVIEHVEWICAALPNTADALTVEPRSAWEASKELVARTSAGHLTRRPSRHAKVDVTCLSAEDMYDTLGSETMAVLETGDRLMFDCLMNGNPKGARSIFDRSVETPPFDAPDSLPDPAALNWRKPERGLLRRIWAKVLWWLWRKILGRGNRTERQNAQKRR